MLQKCKPTGLISMLPLSDGMAARSFPIVNVAIIVANFAVWRGEGARTRFGLSG
jgi:hypothetical protein